jgi:hypothetical protein
VRGSESGAGRPALRKIAAGVALLAGLGGCYPGEITNVSQTDVIVTAYDDDYDYASKRTFALPDTVVEVCDLVDPGDVPISCDDDSRIGYDHAFDPQYVSAVRSGLAGLGWTEIPLAEISETNRPDVVVLAMVAVNEWNAYSYYPWWGYWGWGGWWGAYPPGYGPGWGGYYPGYVTASTWEQGTLFVDMLDPALGDEADDRIPVVWTGAVNGVLSSSSTSNRDRAIDGIGQMFEQSAAYLQVP